MDSRSTCDRATFRTDLIAFGADDRHQGSRAPRQNGRIEAERRDPPMLGRVAGREKRLIELVGKAPSGYLDPL